MSAAAPLDHRRDAIVRDYLPFVQRIARGFARRLPDHVRFEDLVSAGVVGLLEALQRFDDGRDTEFSTFAEFRIRGAMLDELRRRDLMARDARHEAKRIQSTIELLAQRHGRQPEEKEIANELDLSVEALRERLAKVAPVSVLSIDDLRGEPVANQSGPEEDATRRQTLERLMGAISQLSERHQQVLQMYYKEEFTLKQIGDVFGVTESRVSQILSEITLRLRGLMGAKNE